MTEHARTVVRGEVWQWIEREVWLAYDPVALPHTVCAKTWYTYDDVLKHIRDTGSPERIAFIRTTEIVARKVEIR